MEAMMAGALSRMAALGLMLAAVGCSRTAPPAGGLVLVIETDLKVPEDFDRIHVEVTQLDRVILSEDDDVGAGHALLPKELRVPSIENSMPVVARAVAYKSGEARIERSAVTPIPTLRLGLVRLPLNYLCDGTAKPDGTSTCGTSQTCKLGTCRPSAVPPADVPSYPGSSPAAGVDAGGMNMINMVGGGCFDVLACFAGAAPAEVEEVSCSILLPPGVEQGQVNVAIKLPPKSAGICNDDACWVILDKGGDGWSIEGQRLRLPEALCVPRPDGRRLTVAMTTICLSKTAATPPCGAWSREMTPIPQPPPPPPLGEACSGPMVQACGNCGTQTRQCLNGRFTSWSNCTSEGSCTPISTQACGLGGTQLCGGDCRWAPCAGQRCDGPDTESCGKCGTHTRTCNNGTWSEWSACSGQGECASSSTQACAGNGTQTCDGMCRWGSCANRVCPGPDMQACGNCGTRRRTCDAATGTWSDWSVCQGEGVCAPNSTLSCSGGGSQTCGGSCQWTGCTGLTCDGAAAETCGNCGTRRRTCDTRTGTWSDWSACGQEGSCNAGAVEGCGMDGKRTCGTTCQWGTCEDQKCSGPDKQDCGNCGTQTRVCNNGIWSDWAECSNQGVCVVNSARACGDGGLQTCGLTCQWGGCFQACLRNHGGCDPLTTCKNAGSGRICGDCPPGYAGSGDTACVDVDECMTDNGGCDKLTQCTNTAGSRTCSACPAGYVDMGTGGATICLDVDECVTNNGGCSPDAACTNTAGSHACACNAGFAGDGVICLNDDPSLVSLVLSGGVVLTPGFSPATTSYTASVGGDVLAITVTPTALRPTAVKLEVNDVVVASGSASGAIILEAGSNTFTVKATADSGTVRVYSVVVTRTDASQTVALPAQAVARSSGWIDVTSPFAQDQNRNGYSTVEYSTDPNGPFAAAGLGRPGDPAWRQTAFGSLTANTAYYVRLTYVDPDGVVGPNPQTLGPIITVPIEVDAVTVGAMSSQMLADEIYVSVPIADDANSNSLAFVDYASASSGPWIRVCGTASTTYAPKRCRVRSLTPNTQYWVRATVSDPDGVNGQAVQTAGPITFTGPPNLALGKPTTADPGWGCCPSPGELVNGRIQDEDWTHGFAWTGGNAGWAGGAPGWKQATIDLGAVTQFHRVLIWYHDPQSLPTAWKIQHSLDGATWTDAYSTTTPICRTASAQMPGAWYDPACSHEATFAPISARYVRYTFDDRTLFNDIHGWATEIEVY
jgi:hypothetical protein